MRPLARVWNDRVAAEVTTLTSDGDFDDAYARIARAQLAVGGEIVFTASTISAAQGNAQALASAVAAESQTTLTGKLHSEGGELGTWDVVLAECRSGEVDGFYGVDLSIAGSKDVRLRYVHDEAKARS